MTPNETIDIGAAFEALGTLTIPKSRFDIDRAIVLRVLKEGMLMAGAIEDDDSLESDLELIAVVGMSNIGYKFLRGSHNFSVRQSSRNRTAFRDLNGSEVRSASRRLMGFRPFQSSVDEIEFV